MSSQRILLIGGQVVDPANNVNKISDVEIVDRKITRVGENLLADDKIDDNDVKIDGDVVKIDVRGCFVVPGLIDVHAHVYQHATVLGVDPDTTCLARGKSSIKPKIIHLIKKKTF